MPQTSTGVPGVAIVAVCTVPAPGDFVTGAGLKTCADGINADLATIKSGAYTTSASVSCTGSWQWSQSATFSGHTFLGARAVLRSPRVAVPDGGATKRLGVIAFAGTDYVGKAFQLDLSPGATPRIRTLADAGPLAEEEIDIFWGEGATALATGNKYEIQRQDSTVICSFIVTAIGSNALTMWARFEYSGGVWRLGASTGQWYDGAANVGVIPGAGA